MNKQEPFDKYVEGLNSRDFGRLLLSVCMRVNSRLNGLKADVNDQVCATLNTLGQYLIRCYCPEEDDA